MRMMIGVEGTGAEDWRGWIDFFVCLLLMVCVLCGYLIE